MLSRIEMAVTECVDQHDLYRRVQLGHPLLSYDA